MLAELAKAFYCPGDPYSNQYARQNPENPIVRSTNIDVYYNEGREGGGKGSPHPHSMTNNPMLFVFGGIKEWTEVLDSAQETETSKAKWDDAPKPFIPEPGNTENHQCQSCNNADEANSPIDN